MSEMTTTDSGADTNTTEATESFVSTSMDIVLCLLAVLLSVYICTGNLMTIYVIKNTPSLRTLPNLYVASLAVADFVVGLVLILLALFILPPTRLALFYRYINLCVLMQGTGIGMTAVSAIHMTFISVDRYLYIVRPYFYQRFVKVKVVIPALCFAWTFGIVYSLIPQFIFIPYGKIPLCDVTLVLPIAYLFYSSSVVYWSMVIVIVIMYVLILHTAYKQRHAIQSLATNGNGNDSKGQATALRKAKMKSIRFFLTVFGCFFVCLTPVIMCMALDFYFSIPGDIYRFMNILAETNSGMNFIIYCILNKDFRYAIFKAIGIKTPERQNNQEAYTFTTTTQ